MKILTFFYVEIGDKKLYKSLGDFEASVVYGIQPTLFMITKFHPKQLFIASSFIFSSFYVSIFFPTSWTFKLVLSFMVLLDRMEHFR